jgi:hypothetical protein
MLLSKYSLDRNNTIVSLFRTQYTPDFLIAEYYGLRNIIFWVTKDLASVHCCEISKELRSRVSRFFTFFAFSAKIKWMSANFHFLKHIFHIFSNGLLRGGHDFYGHELPVYKGK